MRLAALPGSAEQLLADFETQLAVAYAATPPPTKGAWRPVPPVSYVAPGGEVPMDGESLVVYMGPITQGQPGAPNEMPYVVVSALTFVVTLYVQILRVVRVNTGDGFDPAKLAPSSTQIDLDGQQTLCDSAALVQAAIAIKAAAGDVPQGEGFAIGSTSLIGPVGGLAGVRLALHMSLD